MQDNFESNIPLTYVVIVFICLSLLSLYSRKRLRERALIREGQLPFDRHTISSVEQRLAANKEWSSGKIHSRGWGLMLAFWLLALVWNLCFGGAFIKNLSNPEMKAGGLIVLGIFSVLGIVPIYLAIRATIRQFRYGESTCHIDGKAGILGQEMKGFIRTKKDIEATGDFVVSIQCIETYEYGAGKNRTTSTRIHWKQEKQVSSSTRSSSTGIPFSFTLPKSSPETAYQLSRGKINWQIFVNAPTNGINYSTTFVVPVFKMNYEEE